MRRISNKFRARARAGLAGFRESLSLAWLRLGRRASQFTAGGRWTDRLQSPVRRNLRCFWFDGLFASASDSIVISYLSLYVLALGASRAQIGLMDALSSLSAALLLLPGAALVERRGRRKQLVVTSGGGAARLALLLLALIPLGFTGPAAITLFIALAVARSAFGNLALPAWVSLTADIVPLSWRGRYFASRNIAMEVAKVVFTLLAGVLITRVSGSDGSATGYQIAMGLAFALGMISTFSFARIEDPHVAPPRQPKGHGPRFSMVRHLRGYPDFLAFCGTAALWNFSLNIAGPFFNVCLVERFDASASVVGVLTIVSSLAALPGQRLFGALADRWGPRRIQLITGLLIPLLPFSWVLIDAPWHVVPINLVGGFLWSGYNLACFNLLLALTPEDRRPRYSALYQIVITASLAFGAALGGFVAERWGYNPIFVLSGVGRLVAALLFALFIRRSADGDGVR